MNGTRVHALWRQCSESLLNGHYLRLSVHFVARDILTRIWVGNILGFASSTTRFFWRNWTHEYVVSFYAKIRLSRWSCTPVPRISIPTQDQENQTLQTPHQPYPPTPIPFTSFQYSGSTPFHSATASQAGSPVLSQLFFWLHQASTAVKLVLFQVFFLSSSIATIRPPGC